MAPTSHACCVWLRVQLPHLATGCSLWVQMLHPEPQSPTASCCNPLLTPPSSSHAAAPPAANPTLSPRAAATPGGKTPAPNAAEETETATKRKS